MLFRQDRNTTKQQQQATTMQQFITVDYIVSEKFIVPKGINLKDKEQVKNYWIKYNYLNIELVSGEIIKVDSEGWIHSFDYKYPNIGDDEMEIEEEEVEEDEQVQKEKVVVDKDYCGEPGSLNYLFGMPISKCMLID